MLITFTNARWLGCVQAPGTPICIQGSRIKSVSIQERSEVVVILDDSTIIVTCETREAAVSEQARIARQVNGEPQSSSAAEPSGEPFTLAIGATLDGHVVIDVELPNAGKSERLSRRVTVGQAQRIQRKLKNAIEAAEESAT